jgi:primosomal protein N' (replication factor Y)
VAIGTRSAVFAPLQKLGVIVIDEEHDSSYKQGDTPRYHARSLAAMRARMEGALLLLGSATPSLESWHHAVNGRYTLYELENRATEHTLPEVRIVDRRTKKGEPAPPVLSEDLQGAIASRLEANRQAMLLLNRRGYATVQACVSCGWVAICGACNVSMTWHRRRARLVCHHCGSEESEREACPDCSGSDLVFGGVGTEQVERLLSEAFPEASIARMDVDTTGGKWAHGKILRRMRDREVDILLGTQMISKGLDLPGVTLVGVIDADVGLSLPDFRASERTFQLLSQVAGRAGRGDEAGEVLIQTTRPEHPPVRHAITHNYLAFAREEIADRAAPGYPPHRRLANLVVSGEDETSVAERADELADWLGEVIAGADLPVVIVGPAPCPIDRLRGRWRWHMLVKSHEAKPLGKLLRHAARHSPVKGATRLEIDRDPESLL